MRLSPLALLVVACVGPALAQNPSFSDSVAIFEAAGYKPQGARWVRCEEDPPTAAYSPGSIELQDLNGDGTREAWVRESSSFCYGAAGEHVTLLRRDGDKWVVLIESAGVALPHATKHDGWPDIEVGGPTESAMYRWNGTAYGR
ncbi:hypothetical protein LK996_02815 [Lysobacter sp. A6]|uniref:FG-GAP repeat protein n=1 Tax=Noviluteimonas lactosilytica TaxID=2888523 RepID=A0ABS8JEJ4_9GAMM|nr:hypothetical protein [Lysobacter lactosilyticus]MCC8362017.1 hypothetical protein [Lysobacter lactosilyticus]